MSAGEVWGRWIESTEQNNAKTRTSKLGTKDSRLKVNIREVHLAEGEF
jgi:hypothetical protein